MQEFWNSIIAYFKGLGVNFLFGILLLVVGLIVVKLVKIGLKAIFKRRKRDEAMTHFIISLIDVVLKIIVLISALATMGVNTASIIAVLGTCGVAIGLALKDSLGNLASGMIIIFNKPFKKDDWIDAGGVSGSVQEINLFNTTLLTADNKVVVLPNSVAVNNPIVNYNGSDARRLDVDVNVRKGTDLDEVRALLTEIAENDADVSKVIDYQVVLVEQTIGYVNMQLRVWVPSSIWWDCKFRLNESVYNALKKADMLPPSPAMDVTVTENK